MRPIVTSLAVAVLAVGTPAAAQDFLGAIARQAAASAAATLANRAAQGATDAVTNAVTRPRQPQGQPQSQPSAPPAQTAPAAPARPEIRLHGAVQPWSPEGDLIFATGNSSQPDLLGKPYWEVSAFCAALSRTVDIQIEKQRRQWAETGKVYPEEYAQDRLKGVESQVAYQRRFALLRMNLDRPGQDNAATFDARVIQTEAELRARDWTPRTSWTDLSGQCSSYQVINGNFLGMMDAGRGPEGRPYK